MSLLCLRNSQKVQKIDLRLLRKVILHLLREVIGEKHFELGVRLVAADEMAKVNETFLQHTGSTDVVTFDYAEEDMKPGGLDDAPSPSGEERGQRTLHGEIFISIDDAMRQSKQFRTNWQSELVRYVVHGILHLRGFDDLNAKARQKMKREENRILKHLEQKFPLAHLRRKTGT